MQRKKLNGNIICARWRGIRLPGEYIAVNRRTGGLEIQYQRPAPWSCVNRRTGGLEKEDLKPYEVKCVNRRTGGLEICI